MTQPNDEIDSAAREFFSYLNKRFLAAKGFKREGRIQESNNEILMAVEIGEEALDDNPKYYDDVYLLNLIARLHVARAENAPDGDMRRKNSKRAIELLRKACEIEPQNNITSTFLARLLIRKRDFEEALELLEGVYAREKPPNAAVLDNLCDIYLKSGQAEAALQMAEEFIAVYPHSHIAWNHKAQALLGLNNRPDAEVARQESMRLYELRRQVRASEDHAERAIRRDTGSSRGEGRI